MPRHVPDTIDRAGVQQRPTRAFLQHIEDQAVQIRRQAGLGPLGRLDPWALSDKLGLTIVTPDDVEAMTFAQRAQVREITPQQWSGTGIPLPDGILLVLLHPDQSHERAAVTALEEVAHIHFGHEPSRISALPNGVVKRTFNARNEQEAYWTAAAALLPRKAVALAVWRKQSADELAAEYGVSVELATFRIKILGLWPEYKKAMSSRGAP